MTPSFNDLLKQLKKLPGLGYRSAERIALHLLVEKPDSLPALQDSLARAAARVRRCRRCGNLAEEECCGICLDGRRDSSRICLVEHVPDLVAIENSGAFRGLYHVLHGKLSPMRGVGAEDLNLKPLQKRLEEGNCAELILALSNDIEGEATCHYIADTIIGDRPVAVSRIGFGLPSGGGVVYANQVTLKSALDGRRAFGGPG